MVVCDGRAANGRRTVYLDGLPLSLDIGRHDNRPDDSSPSPDDPSALGTSDVRSEWIELQREPEARRAWRCVKTNMGRTGSIAEQ